MMVYKDIISLTNYWVIRENIFSTKNIMYISFDHQVINELNENVSIGISIILG